MFPTPGRARLPGRSSMGARLQSGETLRTRARCADEGYRSRGRQCRGRCVGGSTRRPKRQRPSRHQAKPQSKSAPGNGQSAKRRQMSSRRLVKATMFQEMKGQATTPADVLRHNCPFSLTLRHEPRGVLRRLHVLIRTSITGTAWRTYTHAVCSQPVMYPSPHRSQ
jgi:hypothetical protein